MKPPAYAAGRSFQTPTAAPAKTAAPARSSDWCKVLRINIPRMTHEERPEINGFPGRSKENSQKKHYFYPHPSLCRRSRLCLTTLSCANYECCLEQKMILLEICHGSLKYCMVYILYIYIKIMSLCESSA